MLEDRLIALFKTPEEYTVLEKMTGSSLLGKKYKPLFPYFQSLKSSEADKGAFRIVSDTYVTSESGTGVVHQAPGFGEDDFRVCLKYGILRKVRGIVQEWCRLSRFRKKHGCTLKYLRRKGVGYALG